MLIADLIHSCSNEKVAEAALCCLGGRFAENVNVAARDKGMSAGAFVVAVVQNFSCQADAATRESLREKIVCDDHPLLEGLRTLLECALGESLMPGKAAMGLTPMVRASVACSGQHIH
jgi:hypothetical protein